MKGRQFPILPILLLCVMGYGAYWLYENVELEEIEYEAKQSEEARSNGFLAALRLLEKEGFNFTVSKHRGVFSSLDVNTTGVLWVADLTVLAHQQEADDIHAWVKSGGILLTSPHDITAFEESTVSGDYLLKLGFSALNEYELEEALDQHEIFIQGKLDSERSDSSGAKRALAYQAPEIALPDEALGSTIVTMLPQTPPYFEHTDTAKADTQVIIDTPYLVQKKIGTGYVTVYNSHYLFNNTNIDLEDHGYLLLWLTQPANTKNVATVLYPAEKPGLFSLLWSRFTLTILLLGVVLAGFLRWASTRLGPIEHELPPIQNNLMAHLEARGEFWYRHKHTDKIVADIQHAAVDNLLKRRGQLGGEYVDDSINKTESIKQASELLRCSPVTAEQALFGKIRKDAAILSASRVLQKINHHKPFKPK